MTINRPHVRNAVDPATARELVECFQRFATDDSLLVAVLAGAGTDFCAGFDLKALAAGEPVAGEEDGGPMGPTLMSLDKPVIAAVEGHAVGGGLELALWCDLRVAGAGATLGVFNRRFGVPLVDGGTVRLPRLIGQGRALDLVLTGRAVGAQEALSMGLVDRVVDAGRAFDAALELAAQVAAFPQHALRADRRSLLDQWSLPLPDALLAEHRGGAGVIAKGEPREGARRFAKGSGRHGR